MHTRQTLDFDTSSFQKRLNPGGHELIHIISKKDGPRREDIAAKRIIKENRSTIEALANQFSGGAYSAMRQPPRPPEPEKAFRRHTVGIKNNTAPATRAAYVRVSLNGRVVVVDGDTNKQLHFLGEIRSHDNGQEFVLATKQNKFYSPMDDELSRKLAKLDHKTVNGEFSEENLATEIHERLGLG